jgi:hypothetical protein
VVLKGYDATYPVYKSAAVMGIEKFRRERKMALLINEKKIITFQPSLLKYFSKKCLLDEMKLLRITQTIIQPQNDECTDV